jgi:hypothetical protein
MKKWLMLLALVLGIASFAIAQQSPEAYKRTGDDHMVGGTELAKQARATLDRGTTRENMQHALSLYIEAGKHYEAAGHIYKSLGSTRVSEADVQQSAEGVRMCVDMIKQIKEHM